MRTLLIFSKTGRMRFLSHLDLIRLFRRAFRRAKIDIQYTEGFNPQQKIAVPNPLPLGYESLMELMMIETDTPFTEEKCERLNQQLPDGMRVTAFEEPAPDFDLHTGFARSIYAWHGIEGEETEALYEALTALLSEKTLLLRKERTKKRKRWIQEKDLRPLIHTVKLEEGRLVTELSSFDAQTLRPGDLLLYLRQEGVTVPEFVVFRRTEQR